MENITYSNISNSSLTYFDTDPVIIDWVKNTFISFMVLIVLVGIPCNLIVIAVLKKVRTKATTDYYVLTMSCVDFFSAMLNPACFIIRVEPIIWKALASAEFCRLHFFSIFLTNISTTLLLAMIAFDRHRHTKVRQITRVFSEPKRAKYICFGIIFVSLAYGAVFIFITDLDFKTLECVYSDRFEIVVNILNGVLAVVFSSMFVIVIVYTRISFILWTLHRQVFPQEPTGNDGTVRQASPLPSTQSGPSSSKANQQNKADDNLTPKTAEVIVVAIHQSNFAFDNCAPGGSTDSQGDKKLSNLVERREITVRPLGFKSEETEKNDTVQNGTDDDINRKENEVIVNAAFQERKNRHRRKINITTLMMFLITLTYITTWILYWSAQIAYVVTRIQNPNYDLFVKRLYTVNCMINPLLFISMSSKMRERAMLMFCSNYGNL